MILVVFWALLAIIFFVIHLNVLNTSSVEINKAACFMSLLLVVSLFAFSVVYLLVEIRNALV